MILEELNTDRFIKITEAAEILGFAHYRSVNQMIERGSLVGYRLPHVRRRRVLLSEVFKLKEKAEVSTSKGVRMRGRPRKYD